MRRTAARRPAAQLEHVLRVSLVRAADEGRSPARDIGGTAIRRGRRLYRGHTVGAAVVLTLITMLAGGGLAVWWPDEPTGRGLTIGPGPLPSVSVTSTVDLEPVEGGPVLTSPLPTEHLAVVRQPVDVITGTMLRDRAGGQVDLTAVGTVVGGYRTDGGWLVAGAAAEGAETLWYASAADPPRLLLDGDVRELTVAAGGDRVAWRTGGGLAVAEVRAGALAARQNTAAAPGVVPVGFAGAAVRLSRTNDRAGVQEAAVTGTDLWLPANGPYRPAWRADVLAGYAALGGGQTIVGQVRGPDGERCLALLDAATMRTRERACGLRLTARTQAAWLSPGERWLVVEVTGSSGVAAAVVDLSTVFTSPRVVPVGPPPQGNAAWEDDNTVIRAVGGTLLRLRLDRIVAGRSGGSEEIALPALASLTSMLVVAG